MSSWIRLRVSLIKHSVNDGQTNATVGNEDNSSPLLCNPVPANDQMFTLWIGPTIYNYSGHVRGAGGAITTVSLNWFWKSVPNGKKIDAQTLSPSAFHLHHSGQAPLSDRLEEKSKLLDHCVWKMLLLMAFVPAGYVPRFPGGSSCPAWICGTVNAA